MPLPPLREPDSSSRLAGGLVLLVLVPLLVLASGVYLLSAGLHERDLRAELARLADVRHGWLQTHLHMLGHRAELVAEQTDLRFALSPPPPPGSAERQELVDFLAQALEVDHHLLGVALLGPDGRRLLTLGTVAGSADRPVALPALGDDPLTLLDSAALAPGLLQRVVVPLGPDGVLVGGLDLHYSGEELLEIATDSIGLGDTGELVVGAVDAGGTLRFVAPTRFGVAAPMVPVGSRGERLPLEEALDGVEAYLDGFTDYRGVPVVAHTRTLESPGWGLVVKMDRAEAFAPLATLRNTLLLGTGAIGALVLLVSLWIAARLHRDRTELAAANERLRRAITLNPFPAMVHAEDGEVLLLSDAWLSRTGYERDELTTVDAWTALAYGEKAPSVRATIDALYSTEPPTGDGIFQVRSRSGETLWWSFRSMKLGALPDGRQAVLSMAVDLTDRMDLIRRLESTRDRLAATLDATPVPLFYLDPQGRVLRWNPAAERVFGWTEEETLGRILPIVPEDRLEEFHGFRERVLAGEELTGAETLRRTKEGALIPIRAHGARVVARDGTVTGIVGVAEDIREARRHEEELRSLNRALSFVSASNTALVRDTPREELLRDVCRVAIDIGGYSHIWIHVEGQDGGPDETLQRSSDGEDLELPTDGPLGDEIEAAAAVGVAFVTRGLRHAASDWERALAERGYSTLAVMPFPGDSASDGFVALAHDRPASLNEGEIGVLEELVADLAYGLWVSSIREELLLIRHAVSSLTVGVTILEARGPDYPFVFVNPGFTRTTGYEEDEVLGRRFDLLQGEGTDDQMAAEFAAALREGRETQVNFLNYRKSGESFWNRATLEPVRNDDGTLVRFVAIQEDVTEQRRLGEELEHRGRLSALGELAGGVAHDFRNILTASQGLLELVLADADLDPAAQANLEELEGVVARGTAVTERLLALSRRSTTEAKLVSLEGLLEETSSLISHTLRDDIVFESHPPEEDEACVRVDPDQFTYVVLNLVRNAAQAMPGGGSLDLSCDYPVEPGKPSWWPLDLRPPPTPPWVRITIRDTGVGMDAETLERAFDPYFTTKPAGEGTGLGLSAVYGAVDAMGGRIWLETAPGEGTEAHVLLPTSEDSPGEVSAPPEDREEEDPSPRRSGTILLAEDDRSVLRVFTRALEREGHTVLAAEDGLAALQLFQSHQAEVDLILTDGVMPRMSGGELAQEVWGLRPELTVIVTSGFGPDDVRNEFPDQPVGPLLFRPKPLSLRTLLETVQTVLTHDGEPPR